MASAPSVLNIHTPTESFAVVHSCKYPILTQDSLDALYDKLTRKAYTAYHGSRVGPGWLKYEFNDSIWNLDDDSDYTIFVWRLQQQFTSDHEPSTSSVAPVNGISPPQHYTCIIPRTTPNPPAYMNAAYYLFHPSRVTLQVPKSPSPRPHSMKSHKTKASRRTNHSAALSDDDGIPKFRKDFEKFHSENGVRTVTGNIGNAKGACPTVRMLLKSGYRHVYIKRVFAIEHGFIPPDAAPGHSGYTGLLHGSDPIFMTVYLSEEPHFDVVLGRSFFEKRQIHIDPVNTTDVVCLDTGEKVDCDVIILKDGRGEIVTVT
ncbi:hypothetical protein BDZ89DRAFT_1098367 [Hymenopellis radicata]|nr:hypothetical protein BDZ89DRAFT_1098367 [Hymenopellis radicata]